MKTFVPDKWKWVTKCELPDWLNTNTSMVTRCERRILTGLASVVPTNAHIVEIGTGLGFSALSLAYGSSQGNHVPLFSVDPYHNSPKAFGGVWNTEDMVTARQRFNEAPDRLGEYIRMVCLSSSQAAAVWWPGTIGLLFLDGSHTEESVAQDLMVWTTALANQAFVICHDHNYASVQNAVQKCISRGLPLTPLILGEGIGVFTYNPYPNNSKETS